MTATVANAALAETHATVRPGAFLTLHYRLAGPDGADLVNTFAERPATLSLGGGELAPAMEACLIGMREGERRAFMLAPGAAFGERNDGLVQRVAARLLRELGDADAQYDVGDVVQFPAPDGGTGGMAGVVKAVDGDGVLFDFNHPLAGVAVTFEAHVIGVL